MATQKPTIILVPGAWHSPKSLQPMTSLLESAGYTCIGVELACYGAEPPLEDFKPDVERIRAAILPEVEADRDVLVFMHSYGSVPAGEAVKGLDKTSRRKEGGQGGVTHLFYCSAFAPPKGQSLWTMLGEQNLPWFNVSSDGKTVNPDTPEKIFYGDVSESQTKDAIAQLKPHSYKCFMSKATWEPWRDIPATYLYCTQDQAIPIEVQRGMVAGAGGSDHWKEETLDGASHSPFLSRPKETADAVRRAAGEMV